ARHYDQRHYVQVLAEVGEASIKWRRTKAFSTIGISHFIAHQTHGAIHTDQVIIEVGSQKPSFGNELFPSLRRKIGVLAEVDVLQEIIGFADAEIEVPPFFILATTGRNPCTIDPLTPMVVE